ncbi:hypothetical protein, partial [Haloferax sp. Atlit-12N]|uniref:hypothetical protein n=1 Tax=Haloferax sp. Atlit-12N TaxID=2077203 RepID=UPI001F1C5CB1
LTPDVDNHEAIGEALREERVINVVVGSEFGCQLAKFGRSITNQLQIRNSSKNILVRTSSGHGVVVLRSQVDGTLVGVRSSYEDSDREFVDNKSLAGKQWFEIALRQPAANPLVFSTGWR